MAPGLPRWQLAQSLTSAFCFASCAGTKRRKGCWKWIIRYCFQWLVEDRGSKLIRGSDSQTPVCVAVEFIHTVSMPAAESSLRTFQLCIFSVKILISDFLILITRGADRSRTSPLHFFLDGLKAIVHFVPSLSIS